MDKVDFAVVFGSLSDVIYDTKTIDSIARHRRVLENTLFFDRLLIEVGLQDAIKHYPPSNNAALESLYTDICNASVRDTHKAALLYYLRKDVRLEPAYFARLVYLPERYTILINGLWHLDRGQLKEALAFLTEPTLIPTFPEHILYTLWKQAPHQPELALEYYNSVSPSLTTTKALNAYFSALSSRSVTEAFFFSRRQPEATRQHVFELLISQVHGSTSGEARARRSMELVSLPFDAEEEAWFEDYLLKGKGKSLFGAKDTIIIRRIASGRSDDLGALVKDVKERRIDGVNWHDLSRGLAID